MIQILRQYRVDIIVGFIVATILSFVINLPLWTALSTTHEWQWNDIVQESGDELFYLTRIQEAVDGHRHIGSPTIFERRDQSYPLGILFENVLSLPITLMGWRMKTLSIVSDALLPFLLAFMTWFAFLRMIPDRRWRAVTLSMIFLGGGIVLWRRPISPQAVSILPVLWMWLLLSNTRASRRSVLLRSMLIGLMVYSYPFHWTYCMAVEGVLWVITLLRTRHVKSALLSAFTLCIPFLIMATPWILQSITASHDPAYGETLSRLGLIARRMPVGPFLQLKILFIGLFVWWTSRKDTDTNVLTLYAMLGAGLLVLWLPLITGKEAEFTNHYEKILIFPLALGLVRGMMQWTKQSIRMTSIAIGISSLIVASMTLSSLQESFRAFAQSRPTDSERTMLAGTLATLQALPRESVLLTENSFASTLTTYTSHYAYMSSTAYMYLAPDSDIVERGRVYNRLVPYEVLSPRGIYGTRYENRMLYARAQCTVLSLIGMAGERCMERAKECRECEAFQNLPPLSHADIITHLKEAHVSYVLLKEVPAFLKPSLRQRTIMPDGRVLYTFTPVR